MGSYNPFICVDDDAEDLQLFAEAYKQAGCSHPLLTFTNARKMLEYLEKHEEVQPSVIIVDWILSAITAEMILPMLQGDSGRRAPVVILTTSNYPEIKNRAMELGAAGFYTKPYSYSGLVTVIRQIVDQFCVSESTAAEQYALVQRIA